MNILMNNSKDFSIIMFKKMRRKVEEKGEGKKVRFKAIKQL